jgi:hypothetical protein
MAPTNRDASRLTEQRRNIALNAYYNDWKSTMNTPTGPKVAVAPARTSAEVVAEIKLGCIACNAVSNEALKTSGQVYDHNVSLYPPNRSSGGAHGLTGTS